MNSRTMWSSGGQNTLMALALIGCSATTSGAVAGYPFLHNVVEQSSIIVTGVITRVGVGTPGQNAGVLEVTTTEILKGELSAGPVAVEFSSLYVEQEEYLIGKLVMVFAAGGESGYSLLPLMTGGTVGLEQQILVLQEDRAKLPGLDAIPDNTPLRKVLKLFARSSGNPHATAHLQQLASYNVEPEALKAIFNGIGASGIPAESIRGTEGLLVVGDPEALARIDSSTGTAREAFRQRAIPEMEKHYRDSSPESLSILSRWLQSDGSVEKRAAAGTLANIRTPQAILWLGPYLHDSDFEIRWRVIGGLSLFANNIPLAGLPPAVGTWPLRSEQTMNHSVFDREAVRREERRYVEFWRRWWQENVSSVRKLADEAQR